MSIITIPTLTMALKAKKILSKNGIQARIIKLDSSKSGCTYGLEFSEGCFYDVIALLRQNEIEYSYHKKDERN